MQRAQYLAKNTALFALNSIGTRIISFLLVPLYTVVFSTSDYGAIDLVTTIATILVPFITINIGESVMRFALDKDANRSNIMSIGIFFMVLSLLLGCSVFIILKWFPNIRINSLLVYLYCISQGLYLTLSCNLRGQEKLFQYAVGNLLNTFAAAVLNIVLLLVFRLGVKGYFYSYIISFFIAGTYCFIVGDVISVLKNFYLDKTLLANMVKYSIVLVPNSFMWWIMNSSDHVMVTAMLGASANGIYAISYKLPSILMALSGVFNQAWSYSAIHENESSDREAFNNAMFDKLVKFLLIVTVFIMCWIKPFLSVYVQPSYYRAWEYTPYLLLGYFFLTLGTFLSTLYTVNKDSKGFLYSATVAACVNIILNWILIPKWGVHGAAFATCVSYILVFLYRSMDTKKYMVIHVYRTKYLIGYALLLIAAVSMAVPGVTGQIILIMEFIAMLIINRDFLKEGFIILNKLKKKLRG